MYTKETVVGCAKSFNPEPEATAVSSGRTPQTACAYGYGLNDLAFPQSLGRDLVSFGQLE